MVVQFFCSVAFLYSFICFILLVHNRALYIHYNSNIFGDKFTQGVAAKHIATQTFQDNWTVAESSGVSHHHNRFPPPGDGAPNTLVPARTVLGDFFEEYHIGAYIKWCGSVWRQHTVFSSLISFLMAVIMAVLLTDSDLQRQITTLLESPGLHFGASI